MTRMRALWEIVDFNPNFSIRPTACNFSIQVTPEFVAAARRRMRTLLENESLEDFNRRYNEYLATTMRSRGMGHMIFSERSIVEFSEDIGLRCVKIQGDACELYWSVDPVDAEQHGGRYETHNVDGSMQFLTLFVIFQTWARHVVAEADGE